MKKPMTPRAPRVAKGWKRVRSGKVRLGDVSYSFGAKEWRSCTFIGCPAKWFTLARPAARAGKRRSR